MRRIERYCRVLAPYAAPILLSLARAAQAIADSELNSPQGDFDFESPTDS